MWFSRPGWRCSAFWATLTFMPAKLAHTCPSSEVRLPYTTFMAGLPMKPATNRFTGLLNSSVGVATCSRLYGPLGRHRSHHGDPMTQRHRFDLVMGHVHRGGPQPLVEAAQLRPHLHPQLGIQIRQWLVHQERLGLAHDGSTHRHPLTLTTRERLGLAVQELRDLQDLGGFVHPRVDLRLRHLAEFQPERHVVVHRHVRIEGVVLEHHRDIPILGRHIVDEFVPDVHLALGDLLEPGDHPQNRRLSTTGRTDQNEELRVLDDEVHLANGSGAIGIDLAQILQNDLVPQQTPPELGRYRQCTRPRRTMRRVAKRSSHRAPELG